MPQFDPSTFASQIFWLVVAFVVLYLIVSRYAIPRLGEVMEQREKMVQDDLERAGQLKAETEEAIRVYEQALADARSQALGLLREAQDEISRINETRNREVSARIARQIKDGEERIAQARDIALAEVRTIAADAAGAIAGKFAGLDLDAAAVQGAVEAAMKEGAK